VILVFGAGGQLGQELVRSAGRSQISLAAVDRARVDIADAASVRQSLKEIGPSVVVNAAAYTKVDQAENEPVEAERSNMRGPQVIADACALRAIPLIHISTDYVFDGQKAEPYVETDQVSPLGVYGRSKAAGEEVVRRVHQRHVILRTSWVYGEFGKNFLKTIVRLAQDRDELRVVADQFGTPTSTRELASAILQIAPRLINDMGVWGTYHFAGSGVTTWHRFAEAVVAAQMPLTGRSPTIQAITTAEYPTPARRPANSALDSAHFAKVFGFRARFWGEEVHDVAVAVAEAHQLNADKGI
jgi:dTDP-4-dehydrorhamnose reductase